MANRAFGWLSKNQQRPFFLWLHFFDPHDPYDPPAPFKARYASAPYDGEIAYTDSVVGSVMEVLRRHGLFENCLIVVAADHGEAFGEHGETRHGLLLYDETVHVPLLLKLPAGRFGGRRVQTRVALADIAPSLLQGAGVAVPTSVQAQSLFSLIDAIDADALDAPERAGEKQKRNENAVYSETNYAHRTLGWSELRSWRAGRYLYVQAPRKELYDQSSDPAAAKNLATTTKAVADTLGAQLSDFWQKTRSEQTEQVKLDPTQAESLHALGYLASEKGSGPDRVEKPLVDPKDKVKVVNLLQEAVVALEEHRFDDALVAAREVVRDPDAVNANLEFGKDLAHHQRYRDALPFLRTAAAKLPDSAAAHYELAMALINTGGWEAALSELQTAVRLKPDAAPLHFYLAAVNTHLKHVPEAIAECEKALEIDPDSFDANLTLGKLLLQQRRPDAAIIKLSRAAVLKPESAEAHFFLAEAYHQLGQEQDAERERAKVAELKTRRLQ